MKISIIGGAGFIGSNIAHRLSKEHEVTVIDNLEFGLLCNVPEGVPTFVSDITDIKEWNYDVTITSYCSNIIYSMAEPIKTIDNNTIKFIRFAKNFKGKIINLSTSSIYGNAEVIPTPETEPQKSTGAYDVSKYLAEQFLKTRGNFTTLRLNNTYGINQRSENPYCGVLGKFIDCAIKDKPMTIYGDGTSTRSYTYVDDVVDAVVRAIEAPPLNTEINIGSSIETSVNDLCSLVWKSVNKVARYERVEERKIDTVKRRALNCDKAKELLGWEAKTSLEEGIAKTIQWQKSL